MIFLVAADDSYEMSKNEFNFDDLVLTVVLVVVEVVVVAVVVVVVVVVVV